MPTKVTKMFWIFKKWGKINPVAYPVFFFSVDYIIFYAVTKS